VPVRHPDALSLANPVEPAAVPPPSAAPAGEACDRLFELLTGEDPAAARAYVLALYLAGWSPALIFDGPMRNALTRIGELWHHDTSGVFVEHRATQACVEALVQLRGLLPPVAPGAPVALGCAPAGDPYLIPSRMAAVVLAAAGYRDHDLGPDTPFPALQAAIARFRPAVVWLASSTVPADRRALLREIERTAAAAAAIGGVLVVGGRGAAGLRVPEGSPVFVAASMGEMAAYVAGRQVRAAG
jgi:methanogenic corrinoid protein MtbC1